MSVRRPSLALAFLAVAAAAQNPSDPPKEPAKASSWRESIDKGRDQVADRFFGLRPTAFGDVLAAPDDLGRRKWDWGTFELDLSGEFHDVVDAAVAVVTNRDGTKISAGFLDFHPFGGTISPRGRLWVEKGFHVQVGRFDVPFGNDWQFFASKDSASISRPLTTDGIMDGGYNDVGLRVLGNDGTVNFNTFILRGLGEGRLAGGRLGITPLGNPFSLKDVREPKSMEFGFSYLYGTGTDRRKQETAWAVDAEGRLGSWYLRAEYLLRRREPDAFQEGSTRRGWHLTQELALADLPAPAILFLRYERMSQSPPEAQPGREQDVRAVAGAAVTLLGILQLKAEWQHILEATAATRDAANYSRNAWLAQLVVVF
ncbi:MAG: hypothetical protein IPP58_09460 [Holophagaceae bacterium]|uniref:Phosphate-selective porin O and P n=1 Tax=Candidatus Geothrix skivensis TaxID=2954439 RepID=A0A9D7SHM8_9BACT|nr:hypothetical protein [Candidatus Geothrix skivensis]